MDNLIETLQDSFHVVCDSILYIDSLQPLVYYRLNSAVLVYTPANNFCYICVRLGVVA